MEQLQLRDFIPADAEKILSWLPDERIFRLWSADRYGEYPISPEDIVQNYTQCAKNGTFLPLTATLDGEPVGHLIMRSDKGVIRFGFIVVDGSRRGTGLGKKMLLTAKKYAFEKLGAKTISIGVFACNSPALNCYKAAGFVPIGKSEPYNFHGEIWECVEMKTLRKPEMILFDYGRTLLHENGFDLLRGERALFRHVISNPDNITPEQANALDNELFSRENELRKNGFEPHEIPLLRLKYEYLGIKFDVDIEQAEKILWDNASVGERMPHVDELLECLDINGIRSGVISNIGWSGRALSERINRLLPENRFEFIMASSEYGLRKPDRLLFGAAMKKARLPAEKIWYCGDNISADIIGAHGAGIFPVHYEELTVENPFSAQNSGISVDFEYLHIHSWKEMIKILDAMGEQHD